MPVVGVECLQLGEVSIKGRNVLTPDADHRADFENISCNSMGAVERMERRSRATYARRSYLEGWLRLAVSGGRLQSAQSSAAKSNTGQATDAS